MVSPKAVTKKRLINTPSKERVALNAVSSSVLLLLFPHQPIPPGINEVG